MVDAPAPSISDLYARISDAVVADPALEAALLDDFDGTLERRFGVRLAGTGRLVRAGEGFTLTLNGEDYALGNPRTAEGELSDGELELVSGGRQAANCMEAMMGTENVDKGPVDNPNSAKGDGWYKYDYSSQRVS